jgi:histidyl-tRNA synthetase
MPNDGGGSRSRRPQVLKGMRDFPPDQMLVRQHVMNAFRTVFERYGFEPIDTPVIEYLETLTGKYGEDEKLIYHFEDHGGREVGLRYDLTVPLSRFIATHRHELTFPFKRYHIAPVFRADRPQRGRYREFWQCDVDAVGTSSMLADAEVVMVWMDSLSAINMPNYVVQINHRKLLQSLATYAGVPAEQTPTIHRAIDKLDKIGRDGVSEEMLRHEISPEAAERVLDLVALSGQAIDVLRELRERLSDIPMALEGIDELESLFEYLVEMSADPRHYTLNLALARGLDYYTGPVFEAQVKEPSIGSLGGGGRYDGLIGMFTGEQLPATGSSLGVERIVDVIQELGLVQPRGSVSDAMVTLFNEDMIGPSLGLVMTLRRAAINAEIYLDARRDLRRQIQYADKRGIPIVAFLGPDEVAQGKVNLRRVSTNEQVTVDQADVAAAVSRLLNSD